MSERVLRAYIGAQPIGTLRDNDGVWSFVYEPSWLDSPERYALAPGLPLQKEAIVDSSSTRPVQWYFDNLLPEEDVRALVARDAKVDQNDAFGLLALFGAESAGSLILLSDKPGAPEAGELPLSDEALAARIAALPHVPLTAAAPKRMSLAGAQHKLAVIERNGALAEPVGSTASTHLLKPDHPNPAYPHTVINEYFTMRLAAALKLEIPKISRRYVPAPVYLIQRFDREIRNAEIHRLHSIDACQLLNLDRAYKYRAADLHALVQITQRCSSPALARVKLYSWVVFNVLVGNEDAHLKNLSFFVDQRGIRLAPHYDLLASAVYDTKAFNHEAKWPRVGLAWELGGRRTFDEVDSDALIAAAKVLGLKKQAATRLLEEQVSRIEAQANALLAEIEMENEALMRQQKGLEATFAGELRLLRAIVHVVIQEMVGRLTDKKMGLKNTILSTST